ncbi:MAG: DUF3106 domain-containing protein [Gammaproteobacteria bacterium]|nr:DUF3106 domain-containing protein [Gammaproteobacteria bacterium]
MNLRTVIAALLAVSLGASTVPAYADQGIPWRSLSQDEQTVLRKHQHNWPDKSPGEQARLLRGARKYLELPADKREAVEHKRDQYQRMSPAERERLRKKYSKQKKQR